MEIVGKIKLDFNVLEQTVSFPKNGKVLDVQVQQGTPCMWVVGDFNDLEERIVYRVGTGMPRTNFSELAYIGTVQEDVFVWHYFLGSAHD